MLISILGAQTFNPGNWHNQFKVALGLDLSSGTQVVLKAATPNGAVPSAQAMQASVGVLENRVNGTGNSGAQVQTQGNDQITVTVPGKAATSVVNLIDTTAKLAFRPVLLSEPYTPRVDRPRQGQGDRHPVADAQRDGERHRHSRPRRRPRRSARARAPPRRRRPPTSPPSWPAPDRHPHRHGVGEGATSTSATPKASATPSATPSANPGATASTTTTFGDPSAVSAATMKQFDALVCKPGPNQYTVDDSWKSTVPGYTEDASPWDNAKDPDRLLRRVRQQVRARPGRGPGHRDLLGRRRPGHQQRPVGRQHHPERRGRVGVRHADLQPVPEVLPRLHDGNEDDAVLDQIGITLDGDVSSAPETNGALTSGSFQITGPQPNGFSQAQATQLQNVLKFGSLPLTFQLQSELYISPQTGHASLDAGLLAGILGLILVVIYLFYYYRGLGIVSVSSLLIAALLAYFSVVLLSKYQNFTMSLSAIAGLVVAIGITADSFIVYFERLRDEVRDGKALRPAVEAGWKRARRTILVSDTVSFLAAVLLYHFATSDVQGFAYTLGLTTIIDVIVVFLFTKPMVTLLAGTKFFSSGNKWSGLDPERLGAKTPWRSGRRTVRSSRTGTTGTGRTRGGTGGNSSTTSKEA